MLLAFENFLKQPFKSDMNAKQWFAFVGLLIAIMTAWHVILSHLKDVN